MLARSNSSNGTPAPSPAPRPAANFPLSILVLHEVAALDSPVAVDVAEADEPDAVPEAVTDADEFVLALSMCDTFPGRLSLMYPQGRLNVFTQFEGS